MHLRRLIVAVSLTALMALVGCGKKDSTTDSSRSITTTNTSALQPATKPSGAGDLVARLHWIGKKQLAAEANATNFMSIWNMPESAALEAQTLNKLSLAPWRLTKGDAATNGAPTVQLRALLDDLVQAESYLEIRHASNQPAKFAFAIRLDPERARLWETNLAATVESLTGLRIEPDKTGAGWSLKKHDAPNLAQLTRAGDWTLVGLAQERNDLLADFQARIERDRVPFPARETNYWIEAEGDIAGLLDTFSLGWNLPTNTPKFTLTLTGDGGNVRTRGDLKFLRPLGIQLEPWSIPTNLIHDPIAGFSAIRGFRPVLKSLKLWDEQLCGPAFNQVFFWSQEGMPPFRFAAAPALQASNQFQLLSDLILRSVNSRLAFMSPSNGVRVGLLYMDTNPPAMRWRGFPYFSPELTWVNTSMTPFLTGGLFPNRLTNLPAPAALLQQVIADSNLVYYDWETTRSCANSWMQLSQLFRMVFDRSRLTLKENASWSWLAALIPKLEASGTTIRTAEPDRLIFVRNSTMGLSGIELHLFADWLESPQFPKGFHTLHAPPQFFGARPQVVATNLPSN